MEFNEVTNKSDFQKYLEERARFNSLLSLYSFVEDNFEEEIEISLMEDFSVPKNSLSDAKKWLKEICSKQFILEDISYLLKTPNELLNVDCNVLFSLGITVHKGVIRRGVLFCETKYIKGLENIKQIWKVTDTSEGDFNG